jgi:hypothetical protein
MADSLLYPFPEKVIATLYEPYRRIFYHICPILTSFKLIFNYDLTALH